MVKFCEYTACVMFNAPIGNTRIPNKIFKRIQDYQYDVNKPKRDIRDEVIKSYPLQIRKNNFVHLAFLMTGKKIFDEDETDEYTFRGEVFSLFKPEYTLPLRYYILQAFCIYEMLLKNSGKNEKIDLALKMLNNKINQMIRENAIHNYVLKLEWNKEDELMSIYYYAEAKE